MIPYVNIEIELLNKNLVTELTFMDFFCIVVSPQVILQIVFLPKMHVTVFTLEWLLTTVNTQVIVQMFLSPKNVITVGALEGLITTVNPHVSLQVWMLGEGL